MNRDDDIEKRMQEAQERRLEELASSRLNTLNLSLEDLKGKAVIDLGATDRAVEQTARSAGIDNVFSVDKNEYLMTRKPHLRGTVVADAKALPFLKGRADLILDWSGVVLHTQDREEVLRILKEMELTLAENGEARINPPRLAFIERELIAKDASLREILSKAPFRRTPEDTPRLQEYRQQATRLSTEFLQSQGFDVTLEQVTDLPEGDEFHRSLWVLRKRKEAKEQG